MAEINDRIVPLDELDDFEVAEGDPDVRGWEVLGADGRKIGAVEELLVDTAAMKVRYLEVDLDDGVNDAGANEERHILIPIGYARLDEADDRIYVDELDSTRLAGIPTYSHGPITRDYEMSVVQRYNPGYTAAGSDLYDLDLYDESRFYGARRENPLA